MPWVSPKRGFYWSYEPGTGNEFEVVFCSGSRKGNSYIREEFAEDLEWATLLWNCIPKDIKNTHEYYKTLDELLKGIPDPKHRKLVQKAGDPSK